MEKIFLRIQVRIITQPDEDSAQYIDALRFLYKDEKVPFPVTSDYFLNADEEKQEIVTLIFEKARHITYASDILFQNMGETQIQEIIDQLSSRIDEECHFFVRFDKESFLNNKFVLTQSGSCIHFMFSVAAYPSRKEIALPLVEKYLNSQIIK